MVWLSQITKTNDDFSSVTLQQMKNYWNYLIFIDAIALEVIICNFVTILSMGYELTKLYRVFYGNYLKIDIIAFHKMLLKLKHNNTNSVLDSWDAPIL